MNIDTNSIIEYISENFIGLCLFVLVFFIIYFVDYINLINTIATNSPVIGLPNTPLNILQKKVKRKK